MKANKVRRYTFDMKFLSSGFLDKVRLAQMVMQLPNDFKIVGWGTEYMRYSNYFIIQSDDFDAIPECQEIPEHLLNFTR